MLVAQAAGCQGNPQSKIRVGGQRSPEAGILQEWPLLHHLKALGLAVPFCLKPGSSTCIQLKPRLLKGFSETQRCPINV